MKYMKTYKLYETGEWSKDVDWDYVKNNPDDSVESSLIKDLQEKIEEVISLLHNDNILKIVDIRGHDLYQGAYAIVSIFGIRYTVWNTGSQSGGLDESLFIEGFPINNMNNDSNPGFSGETNDIANLLNGIYSVGGIEVYNTTTKFNI